MVKRSRVAVLAVVLGLACLLMWAMPAVAIQFGQPDSANHPYVCLVVFDDESGTPAWRTTGVLISPTVVLTAGHGTDGSSAARVWFSPSIPTNDGTTDSYPYGGPGSIEGTPYTNPDYRIAPLPGLPGFDHHDVGVVVLDEAVSTISPAQLPSPGLVDTFSPKHAVDLVGYGVNFQDKGGGVSPYDSWEWLRMRYYAPSQLINTRSVMGSEFLKLTANPGQGKGGTTFGDSGGPILDGGTDVVLGLNAFVTNTNCDGVTYAQRIDIPDILEWIEGFLE